MAQYSKQTNAFLPSGTSVFEVGMQGNSDGSVIEHPSADAVTSTVNSSTTPLANGATFTGEWENADHWDSVMIAISTDQNGSWWAEWSPDGVNVDSSLPKYYRTDRIEPPHRFTNARKYFRVRFTNNSGSDQTYFRLQALQGPKSNLNIPTNSTMAQEYDAIAVRPTEFRNEVSLNQRQGVASYNLIGYNPAIALANTPETIWGNGGRAHIMQSADTLRVFSDNVNDTSTGTGARAVIINGLDANRDILSETITLNGTTPVTSNNTFAGVNEVYVASAGSSKTNAGEITVDTTTGNNVVSHILTGTSQAQSLVFYTPNHYKALIEWLHLNVTSSGAAAATIVDLTVVIHNIAAGVIYNVLRFQIDTSVSNEGTLTTPVPFTIPNSSAIEFYVTASKANAEINGRTAILLFRDANY